MVKLSVNINKIATLRNARGGNVTNLVKMAEDIQKFGADGIQFILDQMKDILGIRMLSI